jgi:hypothetical protein
MLQTFKQIIAGARINHMEAASEQPFGHCLRVTLASRFILVNRRHDCGAVDLQHFGDVHPIFKAAAKPLQGFLTAADDLIGG